MSVRNDTGVGPYGYNKNVSYIGIGDGIPDVPM